MQILLKALERVLVGMFLVGGVGSAFVFIVVVVSFTRDMRALAAKGE